MGCEEWRNKLDLYADGELSPAEARQLSAHMRSCTACAASALERVQLKRSVAVAGTQVHAVMGTGGAPEGVLAAAALRCFGAEILARLRFRNEEERDRARKMGVTDEKRIYRTEDLASGKDIRFVATGVTDGELLQGVRFFAHGVRTHSILADSVHGRIRFLDTQHFEDPARPPVIRL